MRTRFVPVFGFCAPEDTRVLYRVAHQALARGELAIARPLARRIGKAAHTPHERAMGFEIEAWCSLLEGRANRARDVLGRSPSRSRLIAAVLANLVGSDPGGSDMLAEALDETPALTLVSRAFSACGEFDALVRAVDRPRLVLRFSDPQFQQATAQLFCAGAYAQCETLCLAAFRAYGAGVHLFNAACCASRANEIDRAFEYLRRALDSGYADRASLASDPDLAAMRDDPRWTSFGSA